MITKMRKFSIQRLKAQSILEYAVFSACFIAALIAMQIYVKRGIEGRLKQSSDDIGEQYAPTNTTADITTKQNSAQVITSQLVQLGEPFTDTNNNGVYDAGEPFTDTDGDTNYDVYYSDPDQKFPIYGIKSNVNVNETTTRTGNEKLGAFENNLWK